MEEETYRNSPTAIGTSASDWREWLERHHENASAVWLILYKKISGLPSINHSEAVDEALCFGWIDSVRNRRDENSFYQFFAPRKPKSLWSRVNKQKVDALIADGRMTKAGLAVIEAAKANGTWEGLDAVEDLIVPADLQAALDATPPAWQYWSEFPRSTKRMHLEWLLQAKKAETRQKRIGEIVSKAAVNERANEYKRT